MKNRFAALLIATLFIGVITSLAYADGTITPAGVSAAASAQGSASAASNYVLLSWNDLGMHCYNHDFADLALQPPYNNI